MSAIQHWKDRTETHHAQSIRAQGENELPDDFWRPFASHFRADPHRTDDPVLERLVREVDSTKSVLDVGGGAGRLALPLALRCRRVTVVEPSESMLEELGKAVRDGEISNIDVVQGQWEEVEVEHADVVLCAHVVYGISEIAPFVRKLHAHVRDRVLMLAFVDSPQARLSPFWRPVHGEERVDLPALPELLRVLWEMEIYPDLEMLGTGETQPFDSRDSAVEQLRQRLYVRPDTEMDERLLKAADELLVDTPDGLIVRGSRLRRQGLLSWRTA